MVHEMESEVDVAVFIGIWKLAHDPKMISCSFDDSRPSETRIKVFNEVTTETVCSRRGSCLWRDFHGVSASGNLHFHCGGQLETLTWKVPKPRTELGKCSRKHLFGAPLWSQVQPWAWWRTAQQHLELSGGDILFPSFQLCTEGWTWKTILCAVVLHRWVPKRNKWPLRCRTDPVAVTFHFSQVLEGTKHLCGYCRFFWRSRVEGVGLDGNSPTWWQRDLVNEDNPSWWILF